MGSDTGVERGKMEIRLKCMDHSDFGMKWLRRREEKKEREENSEENFGFSVRMRGGKNLREMSWVS